MACSCLTTVLLLVCAVSGLRAQLFFGDQRVVFEKSNGPLKQFTCQTCGKRFLREHQLRLHADMHRGVARYVCPVCEQGTFLKHDHVRHMISHLAAGETICQVCFQIFPGGEQLEEHMDVHLYVCGVCGDKFRLRKDMRTHYNLQHERPLVGGP